MKVQLARSGVLTANFMNVNRSSACPIRSQFTQISNQDLKWGPFQSDQMFSVGRKRKFDTLWSLMTIDEIYLFFSLVTEQHNWPSANFFCPDSTEPTGSTAGNSEQYISDGSSKILLSWATTSTPCLLRPISSGNRRKLKDSSWIIRHWECSCALSPISCFTVFCGVIGSWLFRLFR